MRGSFKLGNIAGIEIGIHYSWIFAFILFTWIFAGSTFPSLYTGWSQSTYWVAGAAVSVLLFASVLAHELCHSLVAKRRGMKVNSIVLFIFGGVSNIEAEPEKASAEFIMAGVGPASSLVLAGIFYLLALAAVPLTSSSHPVVAVLNMISWINVLLAIFNIIPAFPLDGGRVFRSIIWGVTRSLRTATLVAGNVGRVFGWAMILFGVANIFQINFFGLQGTFFNGIWYIFIGWFLTNAADSSLREMSLQEHLAGVKVRDVMDRAPECISPAASVESVVNDAFIQRGKRALPVCSDSGILGIVTLADVRKVPQEAWINTPIQTVMTRSPLISVSEDDELNGALKVLAQNGLNQIPVVTGGRLAGLLSRADVLRYLQTRQELGIKPAKSQNPTASGTR